MTVASLRGTAAYKIFAVQVCQAAQVNTAIPDVIPQLALVLHYYFSPTAVLADNEWVSPYTAPHNVYSVIRYDVFVLV